ncbi:MAG: flagellar biosynthetic protein FliQ [Candidatus Midichloria sp.]|nr:flagellar biosynthetic protein FliQ [Candidatus Midichloria sp.]
MFVLLKVSLPLLLVALVMGSLVSLVQQALTQIQEPALTFIPKLVVLMFTMLIMIPYIGHAMSSFFERISSLIINLG